MFLKHFAERAATATATATATDAARILSHRGYAIRKDVLSPEQTRALRAELTMKPAVPDEFSAGVKPFPNYFESPTRWYVPRFWGLANCGQPDADVRGAGTDLRPELKFEKTLRPEQIPIVEAFRAGGSNGLICVPCGIGKTFMAIHEAMRIRKRFLVFVHQEFLADQWERELVAAVPGIRVGRIQQDRVETGVIREPDPTIAVLKDRLKARGLRVGGTRAELVERLRAVEPPPPPREYDCCIVLIQTIVARSWAADTFAPFGFGIYDECHHLGAEYFSKALLAVQPLFMLGLSATPDRPDGQQRVFTDTIGPILYQITIREPDPTVEVRVIKFTSADPAYENEPLDVRGKVNRSRLCNQLAEYAPRTKAICDEMEVVLKEGRKLLVLSDRREHLEAFETDFKARGFTSIGYYVGGMTATAREESSTKQVILATFQLASEGMNIKDLNTAVLATPKSRIEQAVGRIFRLKKEERVFEPVIYEVLDVHGCLAGQYRKRIAFYKQSAYRILMKEPGDKVFRDVGKRSKMKSVPEAVPEQTGPMFSD